MTIDTRAGCRAGASFVCDLSAAIKSSSAVKHPYLKAIREGDFPDVKRAFQDFAFQYGLYSARFVQYMSAVIDSLGDSRHRDILLANLAEEKGDIHDINLPRDVLDSIDGQPHTALFRRFQEALGVDANNRRVTPACPGEVWSQQFLALCKTNECVGVGAIGIGTEMVVASIYAEILEGIKAHTGLTAKERVFFDLHSECDEEHAAQMLLITRDMARDARSCRQIEHGVNSAIELRSAFWDAMFERARSFSTEDSQESRRMSAGGYRESL